MLGFINRPLRQQPGMDQYKLSLSIKQRLLPEPGDEFVAIRGVQDLRQRIASTESGQPGRDGEEEQIVIAKDRDGGPTEFLNIAEDMERSRTAIDEVPREPEAILLRIESNRLGELL